MNIDNEIRACLEKGQILIGSHFGVLHVVLKTPTGQLTSVHSDRGIDHALLQLVGKVLSCQASLDRAETLYPRSLTVTSIPTINRLLLAHNTRVYLAGALVHVDYHQSTMPSLDAVPGTYIKRGKGLTYTEALLQMQSAESVLELCIANPL